MRKIGFRQVEVALNCQAPAQAPWVFHQVDESTLWVTVQEWVCEQQDVIRHISRPVVRYGLCGPEDVIPEATLLAFDVLNRCATEGRVDLFEKTFFSNLRYRVKDQFRAVRPFLGKQSTPGDEFPEFKVKDSRPSPEEALLDRQDETTREQVVERVLTESFHSRTGHARGRVDLAGMEPVYRNFGVKLERALGHMTRHQRIYWAKVLRGQKISLTKGAEWMLVERTIKRLLSRANSLAAAMVFGLGLWGGAAEATGWKMTMEVPYTHLDPSHTVGFTSDQPTFVITDPRPGSAHDRKAKSGAKFFGQTVSASGIDPALAARIASGQGPRDATPSPLSGGANAGDARPSLPCSPSPVYFPFGKSEPFDREVHELLAETAACQEVPLVLSGHACDIGSSQYNLDLSRRRASVVANILRSRGHIIERIVGQGEEPVPSDPDLRNLSRRVDISPAHKDRP